MSHPAPLSTRLKQATKRTAKEKLEKLLSENPALLSHVKVLSDARSQFMSSMEKILRRVLGDSVYYCDTFRTDSMPIDWLSWFNNPLFSRFFNYCFKQKGISNIFSLDTMQHVTAHSDDHAYALLLIEALFLTCAVTMIKGGYGGYETQILLHVAIHWEDLSFYNFWCASDTILEPIIGDEAQAHMARMIHTCQKTQKNLIVWPQLSRDMPMNPQLDLAYDDFFRECPIE